MSTNLMAAPAPRTLIAAADDADLHVQVWGNGPTTLLCIPGAANVGDWYAPLAGHLAGAVTLVSYHQRGVGHSGRGSAEITVERLAADALAVLAAVTPEPAVILGQSMGGLLAQHLLHVAPEQITAAILVSTGSAGVPDEVREAFERGEDVNAVGAVRSLEPAERIAAVGPSLFTPEFVASPQYLEWMSWQVGLGASSQVLGEYLTAAVSHRPTGELTDVVTPVLVIAGDADAIAPAASSQVLAARLPNSTLRILAGGSHGLLLEHASWLAAQIAPFIEECS